MTSIIDTPIATLPISPCPPWCHLPAGHDATDVLRLHPGPVFTPAGPAGAVVYTSRLESPEADGSVTVDPPLISLGVGGSGPLGEYDFTLAEASALADALHAAVQAVTGAMGQNR